MPSATSSSPSAWPSWMIPRRTESPSPTPRVDAFDERPVDLDRVDREVAEVGERRVAGAEVVEGEADAERLERVERVDGAVAALHEHALRELERQQRRREARRAERRPRRRRRDRGAGAGAPRGSRSSSAPVRCGNRSCHRAACVQASASAQRPIGTTSPVSSASGMKSSGGDQAELGMLPADQRLEPCRPAGGEIDGRLVLERELAAERGPSSDPPSASAACAPHRPSRSRRRRSAPCPPTWRGTWRHRRCAGARPRRARRRCRCSP